MRVVVDTNVLLSALMKASSVPALALRAVIDSHSLLKSTVTEAELIGVLTRPKIKALIHPNAAQWLVDLMATAELVAITQTCQICRDPADDKFIDVALNGRAHLIISGDADLLSLKSHRDIPIVTPATFLRAYVAASLDT